MNLTFFGKLFIWSLFASWVGVVFIVGWAVTASKNGPPAAPVYPTTVISHPRQITLNAKVCITQPDAQGDMYTDCVK